MRVSIFRGVRPFVVSIAVLFTAAVLVATIYLTRDHLQWTAFLTGILIASVLAEAARTSRCEWMLLRRTAQLSLLKEKYEFLVRRYKNDEKKYSETQSRSALVDETLPIMVALVDPGGYCRYHNRAFREWLHLKPELIDGRHIRELFGTRAYAGIATAVRQSLDGHPLRYEHFQEVSGRAAYKMLVEHLPQFDADGHVSGFYFLAEDITQQGDLLSPDRTDSGVVKTDQGKHDIADLNQSSVSLGGQRDEGIVFIEAIRRGEFHLYCQLISPLPIDSGKVAHYAILIRLLEEEGNMVPPGAFFPMAEKNGLMPYLDRWVVQQLLQWVSRQQSFSRDNGSILFINVATATLGDPDFPAFLRRTLDEHSISGAMLCFEVSETDLVQRHHSVVEFIRHVRGCGCRIALSGFGKDGNPFDRIRGFQVEFLKIDGSVILNMLNNPANLARVSLISHLAKKIGVKTIAELVESDEIVSKLCEIGIDFSQGSSISHPQRLAD